MKKILSIDGGGIRGIIPGMLLIALEEKIQNESKNPHARLADYFDFFAGTSTGGILSCLLNCINPTDPEKRTYSAREAVDLYVKNGNSIFSNSFFHLLVTLNGIADEKYEVAPMEDLLKNYFKETRLSELVKPCLITSYDITNRRAHFFTQHDAQSNNDYNYFVWDVCRSTSAAPTYFPVNLCESEEKNRFPLVDGGVFVNNPAMCAYSEVHNSDGKPTASKMFIVSLGTGEANEPFHYNNAKDWGMAQWVKPIIDIMMSGASETTDYYLRSMFDAAGVPNQYIRFNTANLGKASIAMDDATPANLQALQETGTNLAKQNTEQLERIAQLLVNDKDKVTFSSPDVIA